jgi:ACS family glucarate transporter-like MFS transporter
MADSRLQLPTIRSRPTFVRFLVLLLACSLSFTLYLHRYAWGFIRNYAGAEFGWDNQTLGTLDSLFAFSYALGQVPSGVLGDWFGVHLLLGGSVLLWSVALAATAAATGFVSMSAARLAFGAGQASCYPLLGKASKNWFPTRMRTAAQGVIATLCGRAGGAASFLLFGSVLLGMFHLPWRTAVLLLAAVGILGGLLFLLLFRNRPIEHPWANRAEADLITAGDPEAAHATGARLNWAAFARSPSALLLLTRAVLSNLADVLYVYWLPSYLQSVHRVDVQGAGWMAALPLLGGALGGTVSGFLQSLLLPSAGRRWSRSGVGFAGKLLAALLMLAALAPLRPEALAGLFLAVKFCTDAEQPAEWGAITDLGGRSAATLFACINTAGAIGGTIAGPLTGLVLDAYRVDGQPTSTGWNIVFLMIAAEYLLAALCWLGIDCRTPLAPAEDRA